MEIRARYVQIGAFTLGVILLGFAFVYWLNNSGGLRDRVSYRVRFESSVSGLLKGSAVLFNGVRVGEVTGLALDAANPRQVLATIAVERTAPVRGDTVAGIDFQGLTGSPVISLTGGSGLAPLGADKGQVPTLVADPASTISMSQAARDVLRRMDGILVENAKPLRSMVANIDTFSGALARNSGRLDGIVAGLERMTGGAAARARVAVYDLATPRPPAAAHRTLPVQVVIPDPTALSALDTEKILKKSPDGLTAGLPDAQWSETLSKLLQVKIMRALEDAGLFAAVSRPLEGLLSDYQLLIDIRSFQVSGAAGETAEVEFAGKVLEGKGRIVATRVFRATAPAQAGVPGAVAGLDQAFAAAGAELLAWAGQTMGDHLDALRAPRAGAPRRSGGG